MTTVLLVGGPADGRRVTVSDGSRTVSVIAPCRMPIARYGSEPPTTSVSVRSVEYGIASLTDRVWIAWPMENGYSYERALVELVRGYQGAAEWA